MSLKPNAFGVFPNSVTAINRQAEQQYLNPTANAAGAFGYDPITRAPITDKFAAMRFNDPGSAQPIASYLSSMPPLPPLPRGGGGGSGGGRMGPQAPRRKIMTLGPRNTAQYTAENGSLTAPRDSALDAAYERGDFNTGLPPLPTARRSKQPLPELPSGGSIPPEPGMEWDEEEGWLSTTPIQPMAKGGTMTPGKIYTVGEKGKELVITDDEGNFQVIPHKATKTLLPLLRDVTPRAEGGVMESRGGTFAAVQGVSSSGHPMTGHASRIPRRMMTPSATARAGSNSYFVDPTEGQYLLDTEAEGMPLLPDPIEGPWAGPGMPAPTRAEHRATVQEGVDSVMRMPGVKNQSRYPGMLFADAADTTAPVQMIPFEELQSRVTKRSIDANNTLFDIRDRAERNRVQSDLAARASRVPLGTPTSPLPPLPGMPNLSPSTRKAIDRNQERFLRSPQGAQFAMEQAQEAGQAGQRSQDRLAMINPVPLGQTGQYIIPLTGQVINPQSGETRQMTPEEADAFGLVPTEAKNGVVTYGRPTAASSGRLKFVPGAPSAVSGQPGTPDRWADESTGEVWNVGEARPGAKPTGTATAATQTPTETGAKSRVKALMDRRPKTPTAAS